MIRNNNKYISVPFSSFWILIIGFHRELEIDTVTTHCALVKKIALEQNDSLEISKDDTDSRKSSQFEGGEFKEKINTDGNTHNTGSSVGAYQANSNLLSQSLRKCSLNGDLHTDKPESPWNTNDAVSSLMKEASENITSSLTESENLLEDSAVVRNRCLDMNHSLTSSSQLHDGSVLTKVERGKEVGNKKGRPKFKKYVGAFNTDCSSRDRSFRARDSSLGEASEWIPKPDNAKTHSLSMYSRKEFPALGSKGHGPKQDNSRDTQCLTNNEELIYKHQFKNPEPTAGEETVLMQD
ncbi:hypothetical protein SK128_027657 [Halocaridina rubra]|uniref:Uncharacterized protein n=1 Tax=Halocaridina rubra TaxID=373956 RepID=A0AAN8WVY6_HALRR